MEYFCYVVVRGGGGGGGHKNAIWTPLYSSVDNEKRITNLLKNTMKYLFDSFNTVQ